MGRKGRIREYVVAPGLRAKLCERCILRPAPREMQDAYRYVGIIPHAAWVAAGGHVLGKGTR